MIVSMNITAFVFGSTGDVFPFIVLGKELKKRGHNYAVATFDEFRNDVEKAGLTYKYVEGNMQFMMNTLLTERKGDKKTDGLNGLKQVLMKHKNLYRDIKNACEGTELIIYMQFGALAYHFAEKYHIPCIRTFVYPSDPTRQYSVLGKEMPRNTFRCKMGYRIGALCMNIASIETVNEWRKRLGLRKWHYLSSYKKINREPILTLYQYSSYLAPRDLKWKSHIHITGPWIEDKEKCYKPDQNLLHFLQNGEEPIYIGFGSMIYSKMPQLQKAILEALKYTGQRAILSSWSKTGEENTNEKIYYVDYIPFQWLFKHVKAVVHHGGSGTTHLGVRMGKPTLVIAFGADQLFWGTQIEMLNLGPAPLNVQTGEIKTDILIERFEALKEEKYKVNALKIGKLMEKDGGVREACDIIENHYK